MSEQARRAEGMPQRWKLERGPDGAWNTAQMTTTEDGEWCKAEDVAAALQAAERRGVEKGLGEIRKWASVAFYPGPDEREAFHEGYMAGIGEADRVAARLLSEKEEDRE